MSQKKDASRVSQLQEKLIDGYKEMAALNTELANEGVESDNEALVSLEEKLMESE